MLFVTTIDFFWIGDRIEDMKKITIGVFIFLLYGLGYLSGYLLPSKEIGKSRQFVILVTPSGPVFGEAREDEDLMKMLHDIADKQPEPPRNDRQKLLPRPEINERGELVF